ncbi:MAG TPA: M20/M25/M40 family metallo-hydrolase [Solirubrobacteraceae bacterium]|nr:M20/M25/M40 family metallo-hydrolase [Solirubrobacteraceae bacterium]
MISPAAVERLVADLVSIDSVNPALVPGGPGEGEVAAFVARWLADAGLAVEVLEASSGRPSVVGTARGRGGGRTLMLNGHLDTVGVEGMREPHVPHVRDGRLYGRGGYDMKAGVAACMLAAAAAVDAGLAGDVIVTAVADEEHASVGVQAVLERFRADACVVAEPTGLEVVVAHKGFAWWEIEAIGRAAHGSRPDLGVDAIAALGPVLVGVSELGRSLAARPHALLGPGSVHASLISGGQELSSYPDRCVLGLERRTVPGEAAEQLDAELELLVAVGEEREPEGGQTPLKLGGAWPAAADPAGTARPAELRGRTTLVRAPFEVDPSEPIVALLREQAAAHLGREARVQGHSAWMDAAFTSAAGIPTVVFGPSGAGAHEVEEWVDLASVRDCAEVLVATARAFCA